MDQNKLDDFVASLVEEKRIIHEKQFKLNRRSKSYETLRDERRILMNPQYLLQFIPTGSRRGRPKKIKV